MKRINKKNILLLFILLIFVLVILFTISKLISYKDNNYITGVAKPIIELSKYDEDINMTENKNEYNQRFDIMNYTNNKINEVTLNYYLEFIYLDIDPTKVEITLKRNDEIVNITDNKTNKFSLQIDNQQRDEFIFTIKYKEDPIEDITGRIKVKLHSYQATEGDQNG